MLWQALKIGNRAGDTNIVFRRCPVILGGGRVWSQSRCRARRGSSEAATLDDVAMIVMIIVGCDASSRVITLEVIASIAADVTASRCVPPNYGAAISADGTIFVVVAIAAALVVVVAVIVDGASLRAKVSGVAAIVVVGVRAASRVATLDDVAVIIVVAVDVAVVAGTVRRAVALEVATSGIGTLDYVAVIVVGTITAVFIVPLMTGC